MDIKIRKGAVDFLVAEIKNLRRENQLLGVENRVMNNFFELMHRMGDKPRVGQTTDELWHVENEIEAARLRAHQPIASNPNDDQDQAAVSQPGPKVGKRK